MEKTLPKKLAFLDVETTGMHPMHDRIIEIGIIRVENNIITEKYQTLIDPQQSIPPFIESMTGIRNEDIAKAPTFSQVQDDVLSLLSDCVVVAHNARFDYGFIKYEFKRLQKHFYSPYLCTVRLFKALYPGKKSYNLDSLIAHFGLECNHRHRAYDDAKVLWDFFQITQSAFLQDKFESATKIAMRTPSLPYSLHEQDIEQLPEGTGVYIMKDKKDAIIYIGKSINIKERVKSHFSGDIHNSTDRKIVELIHTIETTTTASDLGAMLLESELIKKHQPLLNKKLRYRKSILVAKEYVDENKYFRIQAETVKAIDYRDVGTILGIFKSKKQLQNTLLKIAIEYNLCPKLLNTEKGKGYCFNYHLQYCKGACQKKEIPASYNLRFREAFSRMKLRQWPYQNPIIIQESEDLTNEGFIVDKWCLLGKARWDDTGGFDFNQYEYDFDIDIYHILVRYLYSGKNLIKITNIHQKTLDALYE